MLDEELTGTPDAARRQGRLSPAGPRPSLASLRDDTAPSRGNRGARSPGAEVAPVSIQPPAATAERPRSDDIVLSAQPVAPTPSRHARR